MNERCEASERGLSPGPVLIPSAKIAERVRVLGQEITGDYGGRPVKVGVVLTGAMVFAADLVRELNLAVEVFFLEAASYGGRTASSGRVQVRGDVELDLTGTHVLLVDDIVDTGRTTRALLGLLRAQSPATIRIAALLNKQAKRGVDVQADYVGFEIPDKFVVGYGMDHRGAFRQLRSVHILD